MRRYATSLILWASLLVNEAHSLFSTTGLLKMYADKQIIVTGGSVTVQWYVWLIGNSLWGIMIAAAILFYRENKINRTSIKAYLLFCLIDFAMLFINFKQHDYEAIYTFLMIGWVLIYNHGTRTNRQRNIIAH